MDLFKSIPIQNLPGTPLAEALRPQVFADLVGQEQVENSIQACLKSGRPSNMIFWGPPGTGKTTLAELMAKSFSCHFIKLNAVESGAKLLKEIGEEARGRRLHYQTMTLLFVDEIHRWNKAQQDVLLPFIEKGDLVLIGATTENPSYSLNRALLSRCRLIVFKRLSDASLRILMDKAFAKNSLDAESVLTPEALAALISFADGDARKLISSIEQVSLHYKALGAGGKLLTVEVLPQVIGDTAIGYDKSSDEHYDCISAFIKSVRGSDPDASLYYLARMLKGGEDPVFVARRLVILASEDVGNADPRALQVAMAGAQAVELIGLPECAINLAQVVTYLATAPKSNRSYQAWNRAKAFIESTLTAPIPLHLRSANTKEMQAIGYGQGYKYNHDFPKSWVEQNYWPQDLKPQTFYEPAERGFEKQIREYQTWIKAKM